MIGCGELGMETELFFFGFFSLRTAEVCAGIAQW